MITDLNRLCSDKQNLGTSAVTGTASTNVLDNGLETRVYDGKLHFIVKLDNKPTSGTSIQAVVKTCATNSSTSGDWTTVADTGTLALSTAVGKRYGVLLDIKLNERADIKRFVKVLYTTVGSFGVGPIVTAGEFTEAPPSHVKDFTSAPPANV